jgi:hypothetical protein
MHVKVSVQLKTLSFYNVICFLCSYSTNYEFLASVILCDFIIFGYDMFMNVVVLWNVT